MTQDQASKEIHGQTYSRALAYALLACSTDDSHFRMAHVVQHGPRFICSDGAQWNIGWLPAAAAPPKPLAFTRSSAEELMLALKFAERMARKRSGDFFVKQDGLRVEVYYDAAKCPAIPVELQGVHAGGLPDEWQEPVSETAPLLGAEDELGCHGMTIAMNFYKSWERHAGVFQQRGMGGRNPVRLDIRIGEERVATAILLPPGRPAAQLPVDEPLFNGGKHVGQSILHLVLDGPQVPPDVAATAAAKDRRDLRAAKKAAKGAPAKEPKAKKGKAQNGAAEAPVVQ